MNSQMIFDDKAKTRMGVICFIPIIAFLICFVFYLIILFPLPGGGQTSVGIVAITSRNYDTLFIMLATSAIITAPIFIYCLVILARFKHLNAADKTMWIVFLSVLAPVASALFWLIHIRRMPKYVPTYPDIA
jgi:hypothetical protein